MAFLVHSLLLLNFSDVTTAQFSHSCSGDNGGAKKNVKTTHGKTRRSWVDLLLCYVRVEDLEVPKRNSGPVNSIKPFTKPGVSLMADRDPFGNNRETDGIGTFSHLFICSASAELKRRHAFSSEPL